MNTGENLQDLKVFIAVCEEGNFTRAAARLGVSQSALSQTIRGLETRLDMRLFARTTRSVSPTEAGQRLLELIAPAIKEIEAGLEQITALRHKPAGTIRLTADEYAVQSVLWPAIERFLPQYPDVQIEITTDYGLTDIVSHRYDAGVRRGGLVAKDMIAMRIGPDTKMAVVGATSYFEKFKPPKVPQDLVDHACINLRLPTHGGFFTWRFQMKGQEQRVRVSGPLVFNSLPQILDASRAGFGLAWLPEKMIEPDVETGKLARVLDDWALVFEGYHLYYPHRTSSSPAFSALLEALRYRD